MIHHLRGLGHLQKSGMRDGHDRPLGPAQNFNPGIELLGERLDDAGAEPGFCWSKDAGLAADPVVRNRKLSIGTGDVIRDGYLMIGCVVAERVL
jgi:hypothetical protein